MNYKLEGAIKKNEKAFIICVVLWLILIIVLIAPISYGILLANTSNGFDFGIFFETFIKSVQSPIQTVKNIVEQNAFTTFIKTLGGFTVIYLVFFFIGFVRSAPKNQFTDIEHGSSDWSEHGEQYRILDNKKGIILAENNYLPIDKRGNVNVLVVGRFRFW